MLGETDTRPPGARSAPAARRAAPEAPRPRRAAVTGGGTDGNERLTVLTGLLLVVLLAVLGVTILRIGQLLWLHLFLGLVLLGPVALKLLSTGYRFARYYTADRAYVRKGPPAPALRLLGPLVVLSTLAVFATGVALLALGPGSRQPLVLLHKLSFFAWLAVAGLHVLGHLPETLHYLRTGSASRRAMMAVRSPPPGTPAPRRATPALPGAAGRAASLAVAVVAGLVIAVALLPQFVPWTH